MTDEHKREVYAAALAMFSAAITSLGLSEQDAIILGAQFIGQVVAKSPATASHPQQLQIAAGAMIDSHRTAMVARRIHPGDGRR